MRRLVQFTAVLNLFLVSTLFGAFGYYSPISINSAQVPSTQTDFPVLVSVTDARFKTVGNGGHVQNSSGFDIRPYTNSGLGTAITGYDLERYNASTGEVVMWVKVSSLSSSTTPFVLAYGDSGITTDGSSTTTWSNSFVNVYHLRDGTTLSLFDSAAGTVNISNVNTVTATSGNIDGAAAFASASSQRLTAGTATNPGNAFSFSAWVKGTTFPNAYNTIIGYGPISTMALFVKSNGKLACYLQGTGQVFYDGSGSHTLSTGTLYLLHMTYSSSAGLVGYFNGSSDGTAAANGNSTSHGQLDIGNDPITGSRLWNGVIDEVRIASVARSADWVATEYNNQSAPGTFETLGTEVNLNPSTNKFFYFFPN